MGKVTRMLGKMLDTLTGRSIKDAVDKNNKTAADMKDAVARARAKIDAEIIAKEQAAHAVAGKE